MRFYFVLVFLLVFLVSCAEKPICGNGVVEEGETIQTCCEDVGCLRQQKCINHVCVDPVCGKCEYLQNHVCKRYVCCDDSDCDDRDLITRDTCVRPASEAAECKHTIVRPEPKKKLCDDECAQKTKRCFKQGYQVCGDYNADECLEWSAVIPCKESEVCQNGVCEDIVVQQEEQGTEEDAFGEKRIGVIYLSEGGDTYNPAWRSDLQPILAGVSQGLNQIMDDSLGGKFIFDIDLVGEYQDTALCWNPAEIAFKIQHESGFINYMNMPVSFIAGTQNDIYVDPEFTIIETYCDADDCKEYSKPGFPTYRFFTKNCDGRTNPLMWPDTSWLDGILNKVNSEYPEFSSYDYKIVIMGRSGNINPLHGEKEQEYYCHTGFSAIMGYNAGRAIVISENALTTPNMYNCGSPTFRQSGRDIIIHEILHSFGAEDVYRKGFVFIDYSTSRQKALALEPEADVDKSIMANGWSKYCGDYYNVMDPKCTLDDTQRIYLDKYNQNILKQRYG